MSDRQTAHRVQAQTLDLDLLKFEEDEGIRTDVSNENVSFTLERKVETKTPENGLSGRNVVGRGDPSQYTPQTMRVGLAMDRRGGPSELMLRGIAAYARPSRPWVITWETPTRSGIERLLEAGIDGVLAKHLEEPGIAVLQQARIPTVHLSRRNSEPYTGSVDNDNLAIGELAAEYFVNRGYKHFACYARQGKPIPDDRLLGCQGFLTKRGYALDAIEAQPGHPADPSSSVHSKAEQGQRLLGWLEALPKPVAIFCVSDNAALIIAERCRELGLVVPHEIAILGVDNDIPVCELASPQLSSIQTAGEQAGYKAAELLEQMIVQGKPPALLQLPPIRVVSRQSTDVVVAGDPSVAHALAYMRAHFSDLQCVPEVFDVVDCSRRTLERRFLTSLGLSPAQAWLRLRLEEAERLLAETQFSVEDVARRCGFTDIRQLQVAFRKVLKQTPSQFRQRAVPSFRG